MKLVTARPVGERCGSYHWLVEDQQRTAPTPTLTVQSLGSGSSGNAYIVKTSTTAILVDCGVGFRQVTAALTRHGVAVDNIDVVVVTHEHSDHIRCLASVRRRRLPLLTTTGTARAMRLGAEEFLGLAPDHLTAVGDTVIASIMTSHDAAEPCGVTIWTPGGVVSILTDMGCPNDAIVQACGRSDLLVIEANHDVDMLRFGPYPAHLKRRVASDVGHLSNRQTGELLADALAERDRGPVSIWLAHLSATNNRPSLALETVRRIAGSKLHGRDLAVLPRLAAGPAWTPPAARITQLGMFDDLEPIGRPRPG